MKSFGNFDTQITLLSPSYTRGQQGERIETFTVAHSVFGAVEKTMDDATDDYNFDSRTALSVTAYKIQGVDTKWRVSIGNDLFEIASIDWGERLSNYFTLSLRSINGSLS